MKGSKIKSSGGSFGVDSGGKAMAGQSGAAPAVSGQVSTGGRSGDNKFTVKAGGKAMAGFTGARPAKAC
jgi:hypothetical protein